MSQGIIQTAIENKSLHLQLDYRELSFYPGSNVIEEPAFTLQSGDQQLWDEFACLLSVI